MTEPRSSRRRPIVIGMAVGLGIVAILIGEVLYTKPVRQAVLTYTRLLEAANRPGLNAEQRVDAARALCSRHYLETHHVRVAPEGGLVGIPRGIHKNYQAWRRGSNVWICPTNRVGPIYQFVYEDGVWKFDGPIGLLRPHWEVVPYIETPGDEHD